MKTSSDSIRVISCSTVSRLKRVTLIYQSLLSVKDRRIKWTHIGDGPELGLLQTMISEQKESNVEVELVGALGHDEVLNYYSMHCFDVFINLSTNEGVPVSIMEALSCDIPVIATDVGGTSEIVAEKTGVLVSSNPRPDEVAKAIELVMNGRFEPRAFWQERYNAEKNYQAFADFLESLA